MIIVIRRKRIEKEPLIVIKIDDGTGSDTKVAWPYLKSIGLVASFQLPASRVGNPAASGGRYEGQWEDYKLAVQDGFEVCDHFYAHENATALTAAQLHENFQLSNAAFLAHGFPIPEHVTFPGRRYNELAISVARQYRKSVASMNPPVFETWDTIRLDRFSTMPADLYNDDILPSRLADIDMIKRHGLIGILTHHRLTDGIPGNNYLSRTYLWRQWVDYIAASGVKVVTIKQLRDMIIDYKG